MRNLLKLLIFILMILPTLDAADNPYLDANLSWTKILPGTKWCGPGNIAKDYNDLGILAETDRCCRAHDQCPLYINPGESNFGLENTSSYVRLLCECDEALRQCLRANVANKKNALSSEAVGLIYFDMLQPQCFKNEHLIVKCQVHVPLTNRCKVYELDMNSSLTWQWFDDLSFYQ